MNIELKDVIHHYIGCNCIADATHPSFIIGVHTNGNIQLAHALGSQDHVEVHRIKLILKPTSQISDMDMLELDRLTPLRMEDEDDIQKLLLPLGPVFQYLVKNRFDLFNLIPSGQAFDINKISL